MSAATTKIYDVIGLGVSTLDLFMVVEEFPGQESVRRADSSLLQGGGPVATAMVTLSRLGAKTAMIDRLGDDWRGKLIQEEFEREGVSTSCLTLAPACTSSIATVLVRQSDGARAIVYAPGNAQELAPVDLPREAISGARILHLNGRHPDACLAAVQLAKQRGVLVSFDGGAHRFNEGLRPLVQSADICIVARQFAFAFSGVEEIEASAASLLGSGPTIVVITAGSEGSWVFDATGRSFHQPAFAFESAVDTTGAGDAYHGAFLYGILQDYNLGKCAELASAVAAINTTKLGGRTALPTFNETTEFLRMQSQKKPVPEHDLDTRG